MPGAPSSFLFVVVLPGALVASLLLVAMSGAPGSFLFLVVRPGAPSSVLAPSSDAKSPYSSVLAPSSDARSP